MKKIFFLFFFMIILVPNSFVSAQENTYDEKVYQEQFNDSGAGKLFDSLPNDVKQSFDGIGVDGKDFSKIIDVTPESIFQNILSTVKQKAGNPIKCISLILAVILLNAIFSALKLSIGEKPLTSILGLVATLCICMIIINPVVKFINYVMSLIKGAATFSLCYVPIMTGIMIASGQTLSSMAFGSSMIALGELITQLSSNFLLPLLNVFLTLSIVSAISPSFNLSSVCELSSKIIKWVLGFVMTIFSGLLTIKSLITSATDSVNGKAMKFVLSSFVPIVGSALGDAFSTVQGCVKILKSGVGAFFIIGVGFLFLPAVIECIMWMLSINVCVAVGDIFELSSISVLLKNISKVISILLALILCVMTIIIISTVVILLIGGNTG